MENTTKIILAILLTGAMVSSVVMWPADNDTRQAERDITHDCKLYRSYVDLQQRQYEQARQDGHITSSEQLAINAVRSSADAALKRGGCTKLH